MCAHVVRCEVGQGISKRGGDARPLGTGSDLAFGRSPDLLPSLTFHECRHTFASLLIDAGVNPKAIQEFMGHATIEETFSRYGHLMPGARDQARELVDAYIATAMEPSI